MPDMTTQGVPVRDRRLVLARGIGLPRRHMGARRRVRPNRLRHPRGLRAAAEAQEPAEEIGAALLKHRQDGFGGEGDLYVHGLMHSVRVLTDGSGETASTPKIVSDVARKAACAIRPVRLASASVQRVEIGDIVREKQ
jgi:hypothetical protein